METRGVKRRRITLGIRHDVWRLIARRYVDVQDALALRSTCRDLRAWLTQRSVWEMHAERIRVFLYAYCPRADEAWYAFFRLPLYTQCAQHLLLQWGRRANIAPLMRYIRRWHDKFFIFLMRMNCKDGFGMVHVAREDVYKSETFGETCACRANGIFYQGKRVDISKWLAHYRSSFRRPGV